MYKKYIHLLFTCALFFVLISCSAPPTEKDIEKQAEDFFDALQTEDLETVYDTYGSAEWKERVSVEAFKKEAQKEEHPFDSFALENVERATDDQTVVDGRVKYPTYTTEVRIIFTNKKELSSLEFHDPVAHLPFPETIIEEDVTIGEDTSFPLEGKITLPKDAKEEIPAVVLVHGSGSTDYDESAFAYKPFRDLAWGLAKRGVASIRYDKRTFAYENDAFTEGLEKMNVQDETIDDAVQAVEELLVDDRIDAGNIFITGHSLGGMLAPRIASSTPDVAGIVSLAGTPRALTEVVLDQQQYMIDQQTLPKKVYEQQVEELENMQETVNQVMDLSEADVQSEELFGMPAYYYWEMEQHPVEEIISSLHIPIYILQGDADFQVFKDIDYAAWKDVLADQSDVSFSSYPNLNHFFVEETEDAGLLLESYEKPGIVSDEVIEDIAAWIHEQNND